MLEGVLSLVSKKFKLWPQYVVAFTVFLIALVIGMECGWTSPSLLRLQNNSTVILATDDETSWIASIITLGRALGSLIGLFSVEFIGTKNFLLMNGVLHGIGMICLGFSVNITGIYIARLINGTAMGMWFSSFPIYMGEIANNKIRGSIISFVIMGMPIGNFIGTISATYISFRLFTYLSLIPIILFLILFSTFPQTPYYLVLKNDINNAASSLKWYKRNNDNDDLINIKQFVEHSKSLKIKDYFNEFMLKHNRLAFIKMNFLYILLQFSGFHVIFSYLPMILLKANIINSDIVNIIITAVGAAGALLSIYTSDLLERKTLISISAAWAAILIIIVGVFFHLIHLNINVDSFFWIPILSLVLLEVHINVGILPIPPIILSEIFSSTIKNIACSLISFISSIFAFISVKTYQPTVDSIPLYVLLYLYALVMILLALFSIVYLPTTKGKSLQEIQIMLINK